jgi:hypothetical protein
MAFGDRQSGKAGNKNSSYRYEFAHIDRLKDINTTLQAILAANALGKDFETTLVRDSAGELFLEVRYWNDGTGSFDGVEYFRPGTTTPAAPAPVAPITYIEDDTYDLIEKGVWDTIPGNSTEFTYYLAVDLVNNPTGNKNVQTIVYKRGVTTVVTKTFVWDADDDVVSITAS